MQDKEKESLPVVESSSATENSEVDMVGRGRRRFLDGFLWVHMTSRAANVIQQKAGHKQIKQIAIISPWHIFQDSLIAFSASAIRSFAISLSPVMLSAAASRAMISVESLAGLLLVVDC